MKYSKTHHLDINPGSILSLLSQSLRQHVPRITFYHFPACYLFFTISSVQFNSVIQLCPTLCDPMNRSTPGLPVHHQLPEFTQTHVQWVGDAIQPSHPLSSPSLFAFSLPSIRVSSNESALCIRWPKYWISQHQSFQWIFRVDFFLDWLAWSPCSQRDSQESSPTSQFKSINSSALSFLHSPTLTSIYDHWKNHSLD